jgi:hypothetical protein
MLLMSEFHRRPTGLRGSFILRAAALIFFIWRQIAEWRRDFRAFSCNDRYSYI